MKKSDKGKRLCERDFLLIYHVCHVSSQRNQLNMAKTETVQVTLAAVGVTCRIPRVRQSGTSTHPLECKPNINTRKTKYLLLLDVMSTVFVWVADCAHHWRFDQPTWPVLQHAQSHFSSRDCLLLEQQQHVGSLILSLLTTMDYE
jgi:hypothetical protein